MTNMNTSFMFSLVPEIDYAGCVKNKNISDWSPTVTYTTFSGIFFTSDTVARLIRCHFLYLDIIRATYLPKNYPSWTVLKSVNLFVGLCYLKWHLCDCSHCFITVG